LAIGFSDAQPNIFFYLGRPIGTILFGLFLIAQMMEKESALYDEQNLATEPSKPWDVRQQAASSRQKSAHAPALTTAHSH
jgi:hypothetical protein